MDFTDVRYVKKIPGALPGLVTYTNQRTLCVTPDPKMFEGYRK